MIQRDKIENNFSFILAENFLLSKQQLGGITTSLDSENQFKMLEQQFQEKIMEKVVIKYAL